MEDDPRHHASSAGVLPSDEKPDPISQPSSPAGGVTTPSLTSPTVWTFVGGVIVALFTYLEQAHTTNLLPPDIDRWVTPFLSAGAIIVAFIKLRNGTVTAVKSVERGVINNEAKVAAVAGAARGATEADSETLVVVRNSVEPPVRGAVPAPPED